MKIKITYAKKAEKFLDKNKHVLSQRKVDSLVLRGVKKTRRKTNSSIDIIPFR